ncbi:hypothetical protein LIER_21257 [Lithospermum erythrorhizon]|uniref:Uncharacterized protein n=1 Tax=Lithospermum erythrorhizon TaxID=34254 RepID=A0AAV3QPJ7_LITER
MNLKICPMNFGRIKKRLHDFGEKKEIHTIFPEIMGVRELGMYVHHPSRKLVKSLLLGEMYVDIRSRWPKASLMELDYEEGVEVEEVEVQGVDVQGGEVERVEVQKVEVHGGEVEGVEVQGVNLRGLKMIIGLRLQELMWKLRGCASNGCNVEDHGVVGVVDEFIERNDIIYDNHEDVDLEFEAFMREDNFGEDYEPNVDVEVEEENYETYTKMRGMQCTMMKKKPWMIWDPF